MPLQKDLIVEPSGTVRQVADEQLIPPTVIFWRLSFEDANKLPWTNDLLDEMMAMGLFLSILREKAPEFWKKKRKLVSTFGPQMQILGQAQARLRRAMSLGKLGTSREETSRSLSEALLILLVPGTVAGLVWLSRYFVAFVRAMKDPYIRMAYVDCRAFLRHYRADYVKNSLGGTFRPNVADIAPSRRLVREIFDAARILAGCDFQAIIGYVRGVVRLCYRSGFRCWWVPALLLAEDSASWSRPTEIEPGVNATPDGLLGPIFPGYAETIVKMTRETETVSERVLYEWLLISMQTDEARKHVAPDDMDFVREQLRQWGYRPRTRTWQREHFEMLFDRLYLRRSVNVIASARNFDVRTVKKHTEDLAQILHLTLPRAKYKRRRLN